MKRSWMIAITVFLLIVVTGGYMVFDQTFPKADSIHCPDIESIEKITLVKNDGSSIKVENTDFGELLHHIRNAQPTRRMSVNDAPYTKVYYIIQIDTSDRQYRYYVYRESSQVYIEMPYTGIYKTSDQFLDVVAENFIE